MGKRFKGKVCVYCVAERATEDGDHVLCREFVLLEQRGNLPKVPACKRCNGEKAKLEHYLTAVLPTGIASDELAARHVEAVKRRLSKNHRLWRQLDEEAMKVVRLGPVGTAHLADAVPLNGTAVLNLYKYMVRGLSWHHWQRLIPSTAHMEAYFCNRTRDPMFSKLLEMPGQFKVSNTLADRVLEYEGVMTDEDDAFGAWRFSLLYGTAMRGESTDPEDEATHAMILVIPAAERKTA
jgi:hypothetical protein